MFIHLEIIRIPRKQPSLRKSELDPLLCVGHSKKIVT